MMMPSAALSKGSMVYKVDSTHRTYEVRNTNLKQDYVPNDEAEPQKGDHVWSQP